jgi:(p)ppGpp synthase/HD superfamily hydrolase
MNQTAPDRRPPTLADALTRSAVVLEGPHMTSRARLIASLAHHGQTDAIGAPYWGHLARVASYAETIRGRMTVPMDRYDVEAAAWLHDVLEDTPVTFDELRIAGMNPSVCQAVALLTHRGQPRTEYLSRIAAHPLARLVKIADTLDNTDPVRRASIPDAARRDRLGRKYDGQLQLLLDAAGGTVTTDMFR